MLAVLDNILLLLISTMSQGLLPRTRGEIFSELPSSTRAPKQTRPLGEIFRWTIFLIGKQTGTKPGQYARVGWFYVFCLLEAHIFSLRNNQEKLDSALFLECEFVEQDGTSGLEYSINVI
jgi:hypothetical protein